ncbi:MAG: hypothetical protein HC824_17410 [Synechococcales cyanobacterium RM1_1_8]|nr:hypothetical protein [Synechococcales cyanobacterium RM1_1_8]
MGSSAPKLAAFSTQKLVGDRASTPALAEASYWQRDAAGRVRLLASATGKARDSAIAPCAAQLF